jgi:hypothetical protein
MVNNSFDEVMNAHLVKALMPLFVNPPSVLSNPSKDTSEFMEQLTNQVGPLFIAIDEIGKAFHHDQWDDFKQRDMFFKFCRDILDSWLELENVFFLISGRATFLGYVGQRPNNIRGLTSSTYTFQRLSIHLIRPQYIAEYVKSGRKGNDCKWSRSR